MKFLCIGDNCIDYYENTGEIFFGGNPVNVAVYVTRIGGKASYVGYVGDDGFGEKMINSLTGKGVDCSHVRIMPGTTALTHVNRIDGERIFGEYDEGVMAGFSISDEDLPFILSHGLLVTGRWSHMEKHLGVLRQKGLPIAFDFADTADDELALSAYPNVDIAFFSDDASDDASLLSKMNCIYEKITSLDKTFANTDSNKILVATRGAGGSIAYDGEKYYRQDIVKCEVQDTMGAGDSFIAGFLHSYMQTKNIAEAMRTGAKTAADTISYSGAW